MANTSKFCVVQSNPTFVVNVYGPFDTKEEADACKKSVHEWALDYVKSEYGKAKTVDNRGRTQACAIKPTSQFHKPFVYQVETVEMT